MLYNQRVKLTAFSRLAFLKLESLRYRFSILYCGTSKEKFFVIKILLINTALLFGASA
jgi:hypothetical protein